jgi:hypothetical protein
MTITLPNPIPQRASVETRELFQGIATPQNATVLYRVLVNDGVRIKRRGAAHQVGT